MSKKQKISLIVVVVVIALAAAIGILLTVYERNQHRIEQTAIEAFDLTLAADGTFTGECDAFPVIAKVEVTVKDHEITDIVLVKHMNGRGGNAETLPQKVVEAQSLLVDTVSGATYSSTVILLAIEDALQNAAGGMM